MPTQSDRLDSEWDYCIICDGGRADVFETIYEDYVSGAYTRVYNGGVTWTVPWFARHFDEVYDMPCLHGGVPIWAFEQNPISYDEREHFASVAGYERYEWDDRVSTAPPEAVIDVAREEAPNWERGVIRFLQPHNPYRELDVNTRDDARQYAPTELWTAYQDNFEWVLKSIRDDLLPLLDGTVVITADHGQCLGDCGQYLHGPGYEPHEHLTAVPWLWSHEY